MKTRKQYNMPHGQFMRIERLAGGAGASNRAIIKAVHSKLKPEALTRENRNSRHSIIRAALELHGRGML